MVLDTGGTQSYNSWWKHPADDSYKDRRPQDTRTVGVTTIASVTVRCERYGWKQRPGQLPRAQPHLAGTQEIPGKNWESVTNPAWGRRISELERYLVATGTNMVKLQTTCPSLSLVSLYSSLPKQLSLIALSRVKGSKQLQDQGQEIEGMRRAEVGTEQSENDNRRRRDV